MAEGYEKKKLKRYTEPRLAEKRIDYEEIASHSSLLTNRRLDIMFQRLDEFRIKAWCNPCIPDVRDFFSVISGIYNNVYIVFDEKENKKILSHFNDFHKIYFSVQTDEEEQSIGNVYKMLLMLDRIQRLIVGYFQKRRYFFRIEQKDVKGVERAIEVMEQGGGFFGVDKVQAVAK